MVTCPATRGLVCGARPARTHAPAHAQPLTHSCPGSASRGSLARMRARALGGAGPTPLFPHSFIRSFVRACIRSRVRSLAPAFSPSCAQPPLTRAFIHCRRHSLTRAHRSAPLFTSFVLPGVRPSFIRSRAPARVALWSAHPLPAGPSRPARLAGPCPARPGRAAGRAGLGPGRSEACANICFGAGWVKVTARAGRGARRGGGRAGRGRRAGETRAGVG